MNRTASSYLPEHSEYEVVYMRMPKEYKLKVDEIAKIRKIKIQDVINSAVKYFINALERKPVK